jgi:hypothetical protein
MNKIYLLVEIEQCIGIRQNVEKKEDNDWILNQDVGIASVYGYRLTEKEAGKWIREQCEYELCMNENPLLSFEKDIYINHRCFKDDTGNWRKRAKAKGYYKEGNESKNCPIFAYVEIYDNIEASHK